MKRILLVVAATLALVALVSAWYLWGPVETPGQQEPLLALTTENLDQLRQAFNAAADRSRIVALLSPT